MSNKSFSIFNSDKEVDVTASHLIIEVGKCHLAAIITESVERTIKGFELFTFDETEALNFNDLFISLSADSEILNGNYKKIDVFINNETSVPVPSSAFNKEMANHYLDIMFGEDLTSDQYSYSIKDIDVVNIYRIPETYSLVFNQKFQKVTYHHTWTNILNSIVKDLPKQSNEVLNIQFYNTSFIVVVLKDGKLQLLQSYQYNTPEDVLYYLLNIVERFELNRSSLTVQISGMVDFQYQLYRELNIYFNNIFVKDVSRHQLQININGHPLHYFTPFFNLAL